MNRLLLLCASALSLASLAAAQDTPQYELFVGGSYVRVHASGAELSQVLGLSPVTYQPHNINLNQIGWEGTLVENVNGFLGGEFDAGGFYGSPGAGFLIPASQLVSANPNFSKTVPVNTSFQTYLFGPRLSWRKNGRSVFFVHLPVGVARVGTSLSDEAVVATNFSNLPVGTLKAGLGLALSPGVGLDVRMNQRLMLRVIQVDYLMTHVFGQRQDNFRISAGVNITFGEK